MNHGGTLGMRKNCELKSYQLRASALFLSLQVETPEAKTAPAVFSVSYISTWSNKP